MISFKNITERHCHDACVHEGEACIRVACMGVLRCVGRCIVVKAHAGTSVGLTFDTADDE